MSVCGTGTCYLSRGFSRQCEINDSRKQFPLPITAQPYECRICLTLSLTAWTCTPTARFAYPTASPSIKTILGGRNINLLSIAYACRPQLRTRLTRADEPSSGNLSQSVDGIPTSFATHTGILTSKRSTCPCDHASTPLERSPTIVLRTIHSFGNMFSPVHFRRSVTRLVSYYALFK